MISYLINLKDTLENNPKDMIVIIMIIIVSVRLFAYQ